MGQVNELIFFSVFFVLAILHCLVPKTKEKKKAEK